MRTGQLMALRRLASRRLFLQLLGGEPVSAAALFSRHLRTAALPCSYCRSSKAAPQMPPLQATTTLHLSRTPVPSLSAAMTGRLWRVAPWKTGVALADVPQQPRPRPHLSREQQPLARQQPFSVGGSTRRCLRGPAL